MRGRIRDLAKQLGATVLYVTHDQVEAMAMADKIALMSLGELLQYGAPMELYRNPNCAEVAEFFGSVNWLPGRRIAANRVQTKIGDFEVPGEAGSKLLPLLLIAYIALTPYVAPPSWEMLGRMSFVAFERVDWDLVFRGLGNTVLLVALVPTVTLVIAFCMSWLIVRSGSRYRYVLEFGAFLPHALPEVILAVAALLLSLFVLKGVIPLYGTVWLIAIVYVVSRLAFATRALNSSLLQIHKELEEAAYTAGLSPVRTSWRILVPLLRPTIMSVWIWSAILVYRELTVAVFLISHDNITLPAVIWSYWNSSATNLAAAVTLVMTGVLTPLILVFWWFGRRSLMQES